jgi:hypothetical protein
MEHVELGSLENSLIVLTPEANLISLQRKLKIVVGGEFFLNTATGTHQK